MHARVLNKKIIVRSSPPEVFLGVLKIRCKFTGELLCQSVISIKLLCNFIEIMQTFLKSHFGMGVLL